MALNPDLDALDRQMSEQFDREDAEFAKQEEDNLAKRDITTFPGFSGTGVMPRKIDGTAYEEADDDLNDED